MLMCRVSGRLEKAMNTKDLTFGVNEPHSYGVSFEVVAATSKRTRLCDRKSTQTRLDSVSFYSSPRLHPLPLPSSISFSAIYSFFSSLTRLLAFNHRTLPLLVCLFIALASGADWYGFISITAAAIPVPKEALQRARLICRGFKPLTDLRELYDDKLDEFRDEYHGAMICLADTRLLPTGHWPYEIKFEQTECKRMKHRMRLCQRGVGQRVRDKYGGRKQDLVPGLWAVKSHPSTLWNYHGLVAGDTGQHRWPNL
ncbi:MAG: hypothetical protein J3R72DRAFT_494543 [Linnemannia gamsii]|nr:MAG: hypothetical protein J3R72DRAFT_494543 [Linnemannia gamsii]